MAALLQQQGEGRGREAAMEVELHKLRKEVGVQCDVILCMKLMMFLGVQLPRGSIAAAARGGLWT